MKLTGKCEIDYLKWYKDVYSKENDIYEDGMSVNYMPFSMAYGVYVDFFDSVGIYIKDSRRSYRVTNGENVFTNLHLTRQEARTKAIEKANEIYNEQ